MKAAALLFIVLAAFLGAGACSTSVESQEDAGLPMMWCNETYGIVRQQTVLGLPSAPCQDGQTCAEWGGSAFKCCTLDDLDCGDLDPDTDGDSGFFCSPGGLYRLPIRGAGHVCAPDEVCALDNTQDCFTVCCNPAKDPNCGVPGRMDCGNG